MGIVPTVALAVLVGLRIGQAPSVGQEPAVTSVGAPADATSAPPEPVSPPISVAPSPNAEAVPPKGTEPALNTSTTATVHASAPAPPAKRRKRVVQPANGSPRKIVVKEGGATEPAAQIAPDMTREETARYRRDAEQWLSTTDSQLQQLAASPKAAPQSETIAQIRNYVGGARSALKEGDVRRASTLAQKAHLLSEDLLQH